MKKSNKHSFSQINQRHFVIHEWLRFRGVIHRVQISTGCRQDYILKWVNRYRKTASVTDSPRKGRPRLLNHAQIASLVKLTEQQDSVPAAVTALQKKGIIPRSVSVKTARRAVKHHLEQKAPRIRPVLTDTAKAKSGWRSANGGIMLSGLSLSTAPSSQQVAKALGTRCGQGLAVSLLNIGSGRASSCMCMLASHDMVPPNWCV